MNHQMTLNQLKKNLHPDDDEVFTSEFDFSNDSRETNRYFHVFSTTKRLLSFALKCELLATDATHKLNYQGYPVLLCGTVDKTKQFHPFGLFLSKTIWIVVIKINETWQLSSCNFRYFTNISYVNI